MGKVNRTSAVPLYGLKLKLDHTYPANWKQGLLSVWQTIAILPLIFRYLIYYVKCLWNGKLPMMDFVSVERAKQIYGVPIGGIGSGSIGRGFKGEFCRFQKKPGVYVYETVEANDFIVTIQDKNGTTIFQSMLSTFKRKKSGLTTWKSLIDGAKCEYTGLYPRAWTEYDLTEYGIKLICRQISPVIPNNYKDSSLPVAVFVWDVINKSPEDLFVTITFTFKNGVGVEKLDRDSNCTSKPFSFMSSEGIILYHQIDKLPCSYLLATQASESSNVSKCLYFDPNGDGADIWDPLHKHGRLENSSRKSIEMSIGEMAVGLATQIKAPAQSTSNIEFSLVWDMPTINFEDKQYTRYYTKIFGSEGALKIVDYAFNNYKQWEEAIDSWQQPVLSDNNIPGWYKGAIFNETYYVSDGGTIWLLLDQDEANKLPDNDPRKIYGKFGYLEGHEYRMYNTYDVHFYASFALAMNWPRLQEIVQYDFRDAVFMEIPDRMIMWADGKNQERKVKNSMPHDLGDPDEEPFVLINSYRVHDVSEWRDLNIKFVLGVYRDYNMFGSTAKQYLTDMYPALVKLMEKTEKFDTDGDGVIDNTNAADQTYDTWVMKGASAYCGGLWLSALYAMMCMAEILAKDEDVKKYKEMLDKGVQSFNRKLWNGEFYNFDMKERKEGNIIMADQLCGHWYLRCCRKNYEVFEKEKVLSCLNTIFKNNVMKYYEGTSGAVNGFTSLGSVDTISGQSEEVWTGVTFALASLMIQEGMVTEGWKTAGGMYKVLTETAGLAFDTPEAISSGKYYRSIGYMRPLCIWSIQLALMNNKIRTMGSIGRGSI